MNLYKKSYIVYTPMSINYLMPFDLIFSAPETYYQNECKDKTLLKAIYS